MRRPNNQNKNFFIFAIATIIPYLSNNLLGLGYDVQLNYDKKIEDSLEEDSLFSDRQLPQNKNTKTVIYLKENQQELAKFAAHIWRADTVKHYAEEIVCEFAIILHPIEEHSDVLFTVLYNLQKKGVNVGVIPLFNDIKDWSTILCYLLIDNYERDMHWKLYSQSNNLSNIDHTNTNNTSTDITLFTGHANPADMHIRDNFILCGREGDKNKSTDSIPCWANKKCVREPFFIEKLENNQRLKNIVDYTGKVGVLSGCNMFPLGATWLPHYHTLTSQLINSGKQVVASCTLITLKINHDLVFLSHLLQGHTIGESVNLINDLRAKDLKDVRQNKCHPGVFLLLGNPALKFNQSLSLCDLDATNKKITYWAKTSHPTDGLEKAFAAKYKYNDKLNTIVFSNDKPINKNYTEENFRKIIPLIYPAFEEILKNIGFWQMWSNYFISEYTKKNIDCKNLLQLKAIIFELQNIGASIINSFNQEHLLSNSEIKSLINRIEIYSAQYHNISIASVAHIIHSFGSLLFKGWERFFLRERTLPLEKLCHCENYKITAIEYYSLTLPHIKRQIFECPACGPVGESSINNHSCDFLIPSILKANISNTINIEFSEQVSYPLFVCAKLSIEPWLRDRVIESESFYKLLWKNETIQLSITPPKDLTHGVYALSVILIINGSLTQTRRMVSIS